MTLISYRYKFIFLANMKCASTTIHKILGKFSDESYITSKFEKPIGRHDCALKVKTYIEEKGYNWDDFYVFTTIRNPYSRIASCYKYEQILKRKLPNFKDYVLTNRFLNEHFIDIMEFIGDEDGNPLIEDNNIIRIEEMNQKLPLVLEHLEIPLELEIVPSYNRIDEFLKNDSPIKQELNNIRFDEAMIYHLKKMNINDFKYYNI